MCPSHLKDRQLCTPIIDQAAIEAKKKKELDEEVARVKKEYEEKQRKKKAKEEGDKSKDKDEKEGQGEKKDDEDKKPDSAAGDKAGAISHHYHVSRVWLTYFGCRQMNRPNLRKSPGSSSFTGLPTSHPPP